MLKVIPSNHFRKDLKLAKKRGLKIEKLAEVINTLASEETPAEKYRDHGLTGNYEGFRECHIEPDWLLMYQIFEKNLFFLPQRLVLTPICLVNRNLLYYIFFRLSFL